MSDIPESQVFEALQMDVRRAMEAKDAYQNAWKDEILKRQGAEAQLQGLRDAIETLVRTKRHVTKDELVRVLGIDPDFLVDTVEPLV